MPARRAAFVLLIIFLSLPMLALAGGPVGNVALTITMGSADGKKKVPVKTYRMVLEGNGSTGEILAGARVAIPVTEFHAMEGGEVHPTTAFTYQNVGFSATAEALVLDGGGIKINLNVEDSHITGDSPPGSQPQIGTRNQRLKAVLQPGVPLEISRIDDPVLGTMYCEVTAEVVR